MIFRLQNGARELLSLTPVFHELKIRFPATHVYVETEYIELFQNNPDVDRCARYIEENETFMELNFVDSNEEEHLIDMYADFILMDNRLADRHLRLGSTKQEQEEARNLSLGNIHGKLAVIDYGKMTEKHGWQLSQDIRLFLESQGYSVLMLEEKIFSLGLTHEIIKHSDLFIGPDSDLSYIAMTTDTPIIMFFTNRNPVYNRPFRRGIPFIAITPPATACAETLDCMKKYVRKEFKYIYGTKCPRQMACEKGFTLDMFKNAFERIGK